VDLDGLLPYPQVMRFRVTPAGAHAASEARERAQALAAESASGIPLAVNARAPPDRASCGSAGKTVMRSDCEGAKLPVCYMLAHAGVS
jgi:hypothetical protein